MEKESYLTEKEIKWAYEMWCIGYTKEQIGEALFCSYKTVERAFQRKGLKRIRPKLEAPRDLR